MKKTTVFTLTLLVVSLVSLQNTLAQITLEHGSSVNSVAFSSDGARLASGSDDGTVKLWDVKTHENITTLDAHESGISSVAFSPDGTLLASGSFDDITAKLWDVATHENIATLDAHESGISSVAFSPDGTLLATGSYDDTVKLWDVETHENIATLDAHESEISSVAFSPDGTLLASGSYDDTVKLWDVETNENIATFEGNGWGISSVAFSPDGSILATGHIGNRWIGIADAIKLWDLSTKRTFYLTRDAGNGWFIYSVTFSPDGELFAYGSDFKVMLKDYRPNRIDIATFEGHEWFVYSVVFSPDGTLLASGSGDGTVKLWNINIEWTSTIQIISGNGQEALTNTQLTEPFVVEVRDSNDNPIPNVQVKFKVTEGEGLLSEGSKIVDVITDENGRAAQTLTLGPNLGRNTVEVTIANSAVRFDATGISPYQLKIISGDNQEGQFGSTLPEPLIVELRDWQDNLLPDARVTFEVSEEDALLNGESKIVEVTTDANGRAALSLVLGYTIEHTVSVSIGPESVTFFATGNSAPHITTIATIYSEHASIVAFSPDGKILAYSNDNTVDLWDVAMQQIVGTLEGHTESIWSLSFSPDGTLLASGSDDGTVKLWDVAPTENIATFVGHRDAITSVSFSPNGTLLASGAWDGIVKVWDVATQQNIATLVAFDHTLLTGLFSGWFTPVTFSPDGTLLAYGALDITKQESTIQLWDVATQQNIATIQTHTFDGIASIDFSPDGKKIVSKTLVDIKLWDVTTHEYISTLFEGDPDILASALFSPDGTLIASSILEGTDEDYIRIRLVLWDVETGKQIASMLGHTEFISSLSFSSDGTTLASSSEGVVKLWDIAEAKLAHPSHLVKISGEAQHGWLGVPLPKPLIVEVRDQYGNPFPGAQVKFTVTGGGGKLNGQSKVKRVTTDANGKAAISLTLGHATVNSVEASLHGTGFVVNPWVRFNILVSTYDVTTLEGHSQDVTSVTFSPDGTLLATGSDDDTVKLWDMETKTNILTLEGHRGDVTSVSFSPDGKLLASGSDDDTVRLWDVDTNENIAILEGHRWNVTSVSFSPDGKLLASGSDDDTVRLWDVDTNENIAILEGHRWNVTSVSFSPDGKLLASGSDDDTVRLWDVDTNENIAILEGHRRNVTSVSFSPDGKLLASGSDDGTVKLWDVETQQNITTFKGHVDDVKSVAFSQVGKTLISRSSDGLVKLWNVDTKENITTLEGYRGNVWSVAFSPDGKTLASGTDNGLVELWDISSFITSTTTPESLKGDVNGDGVVNMADLVLVASNYGQTDSNVADINGDGVVHIYDIILVASQIDTDATAPSLHVKDLSTFTAADVKRWLSDAQQLNLTDAKSLQGILFLQQLLSALTPKETALLANYPNPFNPETWIPYQLAKDADVTLHIYAIDGTLVRTLALGHQAAGMYQNRSSAAYWDGRNAIGEKVAAGVYFYTLRAGDFTATRKMLIRK